MRPLILHPTEICQWYTLVNEAQAQTHLVLNENTESYLVFLLMRFTQGPRLIESVLALDFLDALHKPRQHRTELLKDVGDKSLLYSGLFPGMAKKRHVGLHYFSDLGQMAYLTLSEYYDNQNSALYYQLSSQFMMLQQILSAMRQDNLILFSNVTSSPPPPPENQGLN